MNINNVDLTAGSDHQPAVDPPISIALDGRQPDGDLFNDYPAFRPHEPHPDDQQNQPDQQDQTAPTPDQPPPEHHKHHHQDQDDQQNSIQVVVVPDSDAPDQAPPDDHHNDQQNQDQQNTIQPDPDTQTVPDQTPPEHHHKHQQDQDQQNTDVTPLVDPNTQTDQTAPDNNHKHQQQQDQDQNTPPPSDPGHDQMVGDPSADSQWWSLQHADDTCAVVAQLGIIEEITGHQMSQDELVRVAYEHGWYAPGEGTSWDCVGNLLEYYGIHVERLHDCSLTTLSDALASGHKIIVGVDGEEIWRPVHDRHGDPLKIPGGADHAIWVTGIETDADGKVYVIVNDSGTAEGRSERVPVADFLNAWQDSNYFAVITENSSPTA